MYIQDLRVGIPRLAPALFVGLLGLACSPSPADRGPRAPDAPVSGETWVGSDDFAIELYYLDEEMLEFDVATYLRARGADHLAEHTEEIQVVAGQYRISPRFLLALMERQSSAVTDPAFQRPRPLGALSTAEGFIQQLRDVSRRLSEAETPEAAVSQLLDSDARRALLETYRELFPGVASSQRIAQLAASAQISMQFPWPVGTRWNFGGVHSFFNATEGNALDFAHEDESWGWNSPPPEGGGMVVASAAGTVERHSSCSLTVVHDGGWSTSYYHLDVADDVRSGQRVEANQPLAIYARNRSQALCEEGSSTGPHVHWTLWHNGRRVALHGRQLSGWTIYSNTDEEYDDSCSSTYMWRGDDRVCPWRPMLNEGLDDPVPPTTDPSVSVASTVQAGESVRVTFSNVPAGRNFWIGTATAGASPFDYFGHRYTDRFLSERAVTLPGLPEGRYVARLFSDNGFQVIDEAPFAVVSASACEDDDSYIAYGEGCADWRGYNCHRAEERWGYSAEEERTLLERCPRTCGLCD